MQVRVIELFNVTPHSVFLSLFILLFLIFCFIFLTFRNFLFITFSCHTFYQTLLFCLMFLYLPSLLILQASLIFSPIILIPFSQPPCLLCDFLLPLDLFLESCTFNLCILRQCLHIISSTPSATSQTYFSHQPPF
jgi:hypothetical protein